MQETENMRVWSLGQEDPLEEGMATHSSVLAWRIPWTEDPGGLHSIGSQRIRHNWSNLAHFSIDAEKNFWQNLTYIYDRNTPERWHRRNIPQPNKGHLWKTWASLVAQVVKNILQFRRPRFNPWVGKIPWRRGQQPTPLFLPEEFHGPEEPGGLQSLGSHRIRHNWATFTFSSHNKPLLTSYSMAKIWKYSLRSGTRQRYPLSLLLFNIVLEVLATEIRDEKDRKQIQIGKQEVNSHWLWMIYYTQKNPKDATRKQLESFNEFAKVTESKINTKNVFHLYTPAMKDQKEIKEKSHLPLHQKV